MWQKKKRKGQAGLCQSKSQPHKHKVEQLHWEAPAIRAGTTGSMGGPVILGSPFRMQGESIVDLYIARYGDKSFKTKLLYILLDQVHRKSSEDVYLIATILTE